MVLPAQVLGGSSFSVGMVPPSDSLHQCGNTHSAYLGKAGSLPPFSLLVVRREGNLDKTWGLWTTRA